ncbi:hypothetical protein Tco_1002512 [Tanacetum coccineum]|uniref:Xylulose kinase-1 n=1 Tax=Tanacetum coccineum TaxID=301880 RepID=A0ABQ5F730_9ASTR
MGKLAFCDYHNMVAILEKTEHNTDFHQIVDFLEASHIRYALMVRPTVYVAHIQQFWSTARVETVDEATKIIATVNGRQRTLTESSIRRHLKLNDAEDKSTPQHDQTTSQEPKQQETTIPPPSPSNIPIHRRLTKGTIRISQSKVPSPGADETASLSGDDRHKEAFPTATSLDAGQDRENIAKTSAMPHEASPRVTSLGGGEGSMQQQLTKLMDIYTSLQRQHSLMAEKIQSQDLEIIQLKTKIKTLEDNEKRREGVAQEDAPNTGGIDQGEDLLEDDNEKDSNKSADKGSESTSEMANVLSTLEAANILASGGSKSVFTLASSTIATASTGVSPAVATASGSFPTAAVFTTASVATPRVTRSSRGIIIEPSSTISVNIPISLEEGQGKGL